MKACLSKLNYLAHGLNLEITCFSDDKFCIVSMNTLKTVKVGSFKECLKFLRGLK